jgi:hypothetical protein
MFRTVPSFAVVVVGAGFALGGASATSSAAVAPTGGLAVSSAPAPKAATPSSAIGPQKTWTGKTAPVDLPGTGIQQGDRLPKGAVLVYRSIDVPKGEKRRAKLVVPKGKAIVTAAQSGAFGSGVVNKDYVGKRSVTIRVGGGTKGAEGRLYAYAR